jgi:uncharacterized protein
MKAATHHQECCCSYNMMKLTRSLYSWSGEARYIDYYERNLYNHRLGAIQPNTGLTTYFVSLTPGAWKTLCTEDQTFWCCTGSALEDYAKLNSSIYAHDENSVYVNLFVASELNWKTRGIHIRQQTAFPHEPRTVLTIAATPSKRWTMRLRVPSWTDDAAVVKINGRPMEMAGTPGSYININRSWRAGDRIEFNFAMKITAEPLQDDHTQQAFLYGPIVLAGQFPLGNLSEKLLRKNQGPEVREAPIEVPTLISAGSVPSDWIKPIVGEPLTFQMTGQSEAITLKPLNESWDRFAVYWAVKTST